MLLVSAGVAVLAGKRIVYDNWSKGDVGIKKPMPNSPGFFRGKNVHIYPNGAIGPRPPFAAQTMASLPTKRIDFMVYNAANDKIVFITSDLGVYSFTPRRFFQQGVSYVTVVSPPTLIGTLAAAVTDVVSSGNIIYCCRSASITTGGVAIDVAANTITAVAAVHTGEFIQVYGSRFLVVETATGTTKNYVHYSAANDFTSWPGNFTAVGTPTPITGIFIQRNSISLPKSDGTWWNITGALGAETVRRVEKALNFTAPGTVSNGDNVWWANYRDTLAFSGAQVQSESRPPTDEYVGRDAEQQPEDIAALVGSDDIAIVGTSVSTANGLYQCYVQTRINGAWTTHTVALDALNQSRNDFFLEQSNDGVLILARRGRTGGAGDAAPSFYAWNPRLSQPGEWDRQDPNGTYPEGTFYTNEYWPEDGSRVKITSVYVDLSYDLYLAANAGFTITAQALNNKGKTNELASTSSSWTPLDIPTTPTVGATLVRQRAQFDFGDQGEGGGAVLKITNLKNTLIHRIIMVVDEVPADGG